MRPALGRAVLDPFGFRITSDEIVASETDPARKLRRVDFSFTSQKVPCKQGGAGGERWVMREFWHDGAIFIPIEPKLLEDPSRRGKVVIVGSPSSAPTVIRSRHGRATRR